MFDPDHQGSSPHQPEEIDLIGTFPIKPKPDPELSKTVSMNERTSERAADRTDQRTKDRPEKRTGFRTDNRSVLLPTKRLTKRYSFEFYEDQLASLKSIKIETELSGENISLSAIVRRAIDEYLERVESTVWKSERKIERTNVRT
jgi:hypothetical protein